jgi:hypothetical protein
MLLVLHKNKNKYVLFSSCLMMFNQSKFFFCISLIFYFRPWEIDCWFPLTWENFHSPAGRLFILFFIFFIFVSMKRRGNKLKFLIRVEKSDMAGFKKKFSTKNANKIN